jgi:hypothetical protein
MKTYFGYRSPAGPVVQVSEPNYKTIPLRHIPRHSPTGFEWAYSGSGPADLALAICADAMRSERDAERVYQAFKSRVIANLHWDRWSLTTAQVLAEINAIRENQVRLDADWLNFVNSPDPSDHVDPPLDSHYNDLIVARAGGPDH